MQIKYFQTAWNDVKNSPGWFGKMCLLALVNFIPIFGSIVSYGYLYGWAREIAWGVHQPMPASIFSNDDGKFWRRGWFLFVIAFVFSLIPTVIAYIGTSMQGSMFYASLYGFSENSSLASAGSAASAGIGALLYLVGMLLALVVTGLSAVAETTDALATLSPSELAETVSANFKRIFRHDPV